MEAETRNDKLAILAEEIIVEHKEIMSLMATAEERAKAIGQKLINLKPELKARGTNLTEFCRDYLPFSKSTAYDYIKIAKGKLSWVDHVGRGNSESSEKVAHEELFLSHITFERGLATLRAMQWVNAGSDYDKWLSKIENEIVDYPPKEVTYPITGRDYSYVCMSLAQAKEEGHPVFAKAAKTHDQAVWDAIEYALHKFDLYYQGWPILLQIASADLERERLYEQALIKDAKALAFKQEEHAKVLGLDLETARMLAALVLNNEFNLTAIMEGGIPQKHPAWESFIELLPSGLAEEWCAEGIIMTVVQAAEEMDCAEVVPALEEMQSERKPFWLISQRAASLFREFVVPAMKAAEDSRLNQAI